LAPLIHPPEIVTPPDQEPMKKENEGE